MGGALEAGPQALSGRHAGRGTQKLPLRGQAPSPVPRAARTTFRRGGVILPPAECT